MTPFGSPVLPLEKITVARESRDFRFPISDFRFEDSVYSSQAAGRNFAISQAASFSPTVGALGWSSRFSVSGQAEA